MLECVINVSEGRRADVLGAIGDAAGAHLLDVHADPDHHRAVFTLAGPDTETAARELTRVATQRIDLRRHSGAHPRLGVVDVVPFVPLGGNESMTTARAARGRFARWASDELGIPCFLYGPAPERSLPQLRREAFTTVAPDAGPGFPHPMAGAIAVGARGLLVAYNLWLAVSDLATARAIARVLRSQSVRALGIAVGGEVQVSCNLIEPLVVGPDAVYDAVTERAEVARAELVGLVPDRVLGAIPAHRWVELDLDRSRTIEARLEQAGLDGGRT